MADPIEYALSSPEFAPLWIEVKRRLGHPPAKMATLKREFLRALIVKDPSSEVGGMPAELDAVWHEVVLNTRYYAALCQRLCGRFVHHTTASEQDDGVARQSRVDDTVIRYRKRFREEPTEAVWADVSAAIADAPEGAPSQWPIMLFVKQLNGKTVTLQDVGAATTVTQIKATIQKKSGIPVHEQRLIFAGVQLDDKHTCEGIGLRDASTLHLVLRVSGC